jgi:PAS domain S-box-containing protein
MDRFRELRKKAIALVEAEPAVRPPEAEGFLDLLEELRIYKAELDLQNQELIESQEELARLNRQYIDLYDLAPCGYMTVDRRGLISRSNLAAGRLFGRDPAFLVGTALGRFVARGSENTYLYLRERALKEGRKQSAEVRLTRDDGGEAWAIVEIEAEVGENGRLIEYRLTLTEITKRKYAEEEKAHYARRIEEESGKRRLLSGRFIELVEQERTRLGEYLHDQAGQILLSVSLDLANLAKEMPEDDDRRKRLEEVQQRVHNVLRDIKNASHGLHPTAIDRLGLVAALKGLTDRTGRPSDPFVDFYHSGVPEDLDPRRKLALFRIAQEAMDNVRAHAQAGHVHIGITGRHDRIVLSIEDDGRGFDSSKWTAEDRTGMGLLLCEERAVQLGGTLTVESAPGRGTILIAEIPLD